LSQAFHLAFFSGIRQFCIISTLLLLLFSWQKKTKNFLYPIDPRHFVYNIIVGFFVGCFISCLLTIGRKKNMLEVNKDLQGKQPNSK
jgi:hypothetical protein